MWSKTSSAFLLSSLLYSVTAQEETSITQDTGACYTSSSIVWTVIITLMILFAISVALYALWRYFMRSRKGEHLVLVTADAEKGDTFAFDNHAFKEGTPKIGRTLNGDKLKGGIRWPEFVSLQTGNEKTPKSLDDTYVGQEPTKNIVPLRSHDFTGLGFNICGNMRDGIYVKDVSHRGPANESGRIQPGDRITSVRISFRNMVYEDALTILSYASPYDVQIETEIGGTRPNSRPSTLLRNKENSNATPERIIHPFFRSQSIPDLSKISKPSSKRTSMHKHHNTSHGHETDLKPAVLDISPVAMKPVDKSHHHKFGVRVLPDTKQDDHRSSAVIVNIESEKSENLNQIVVESDKHNSLNDRSGFDEIDLSHPGDEHSRGKRTRTPSPTATNVKSIIAKGLQNLKGKLHQPAHKKQNSMEQPHSRPAPSPPTVEPCVIDISPASAEHSQNDSTDKPHTITLGADVEKTFTVDLKPPTPINGVMKNDSFSSTEGERRKRKAPPPPVTTDVELHAEPKDIVSPNDNQSVLGDSNESTTLELNATHITIHHTPEDINRKAASLGDLSKIINEEVCLSTILERAMSLELAEGGPPKDNKKRKAPHPPAEDLSVDEVPFSKEPRLEGKGLKKASLFGTLEEAVQQESEAEELSGSDGPEFVSSTPMKMPQFKVNGDHCEEEPSMESIPTDLSISSEFERPQPAQRKTIERVETKPEPMVNGDTQGTTKVEVVENGHEPTHGYNGGVTKDWEASQSVTNDAYVTALNISVDDKPPDPAQSPPPDLSSYVTEIKVSTSSDDDILSLPDQDLTLLEECDDSKIFKNGAGVYYGHGDDEPALMNYSQSPLNGRTNRVEAIVKTINEKSSSEVMFSGDNLSDEQILALKTSNNTKVNGTFHKTNGETKTRIPSKSPSPTGKSPQRSMSTTPTPKSTSGSRIPVRAFGNTSSGSESSSSSRSASESKVRKSRKPDDVEVNGKFSFNISPISKTSPEQRRFNGSSEQIVTHIIVDGQK